MQVCTPTQPDAAHDWVDLGLQTVSVFLDVELHATTQPNVSPANTSARHMPGNRSVSRHQSLAPAIDRTLATGAFRLAASRDRL